MIKLAVRQIIENVLRFVDHSAESNVACQLDVQMTKRVTVLEWETAFTKR